MTKSSGLQTPLSRIRYLGPAHSGTKHLWRMRLTAFALLPLTIALVVLLIALVGADYSHARALLATPAAALVLILFIGVGAWHMMLGMQVVIEDYIHSEHTKTLCLMVNTCFCALIGLAGVYAALKLSFA